MSWGNILGEQSILPSGGFGVQDEIKLESGKGKKIRLLLNENEEPYSYLEHCLEIETVENGQQVRTFRTIRCPKTHRNPNALCPLCDGQQVRRRVRHACNAWDYDENKVQKLNVGDTVMKPIATAMKMGVDILGVDWAIMKTGTNRNDTEYTTTNLGPSQLTIPPDAPHYNMEDEYAPHTIEDMKAIVEGAGGDWNKLTTPPELVFPTLAEALEHEMPNGKYKGQKFKDMWEADKSPRGMISFLATKSDRVNEEKAAAQVIMVRLGGADIPGVPKDDNNSAVQQQVTQNQQPQVQMQNTTQNQQVQNTSTTAVQPDSGNRQNKINEINSLLSSNERFIKGGFNEIMNVMKQCSNGKVNIVDFTDVELDKMLEVCKA